MTNLFKCPEVLDLVASKTTNLTAVENSFNIRLTNLKAGRPVPRLSSLSKDELFEKAKEIKDSLEDMYKYAESDSLVHKAILTGSGAASVVFLIIEIFLFYNNKREKVIQDIKKDTQIHKLDNQVTVERRLVERQLAEVEKEINMLKNQEGKEEEPKNRNR